MFKSFTWRSAGLILLIVLSSWFTVWVQLDHLGIDYLTHNQYVRHLGVLRNEAGNPWQYRPLSEWIAEEAINLSRQLGVINPIATGFIVLRYIQQLILFILVYIYYRRLGLTSILVYLGIILTTWSISGSLYDSDLSFNTYFDIIFYLAGSLLVLSRRWWGLIILIPFGVLNRETILFLPIVAAASVYLKSGHSRKTSLVKASLTSLVVGITVAILIRIYYGWQTPVAPYDLSLGWSLLSYNFGRATTYGQLIWSTGLLWLIPLYYPTRLPTYIRAGLLVLIPLWVIIHSMTAIMAESRLFLVPVIIYLIPATLITIKNELTHHPNESRL